MAAIGGKTKKATLPSQPQFVVQRSALANEYLLISTNEAHETLISWVGDPNAATKYNSKYDAKNRTRDIENIPDTRVFMALPSGEK